MAKKKHDTTKFTLFGLLLDELLTQKKMSFRRLAIESGMSATSPNSV